MKNTKATPTNSVLLQNKTTRVLHVSAGGSFRTNCGIDSPVFGSPVSHAPIFAVGTQMNPANRSKRLKNAELCRSCFGDFVPTF